MNDKVCDDCQHFIESRKIIGTFNGIVVCMSTETEPHGRLRKYQDKPLTTTCWTGRGPEQMRLA